MAAGNGNRPTVRPAGEPAGEVLALVADKWVLRVVTALGGGVRRFGELQELVDGISPKMLSQTLRKLQAAACLQRTVVPTSPVTVEYRLTELGLSLRTAGRPLVRWATDNAWLAAAGPAPAVAPPPVPDDDLQRRVVDALTGGPVD